MNKFLNHHNQDLQAFAEAHANEYQSGNPFPNIYLDNFFNPEYLEKVLQEFPDLSKKDAINYQNTKEIKLAGKGERFFGDETKALMHFLNSEPFLEFLQTLTGMKEKLIGDPYFSGGGQHEIKKGGLLKIHADFNKHPTIGLDRRINVLVYLNKDWKEEYGGHFELWDRNMEKCEKDILPVFNRMAIFSTTDFSYHGHPNPLNCPDDRSRKSLALYYFSNGRPKEEIIQGQEKHTTLFKSRAGNTDDQAAFSDQKPNQNGLKSLVRDLIPPIIFKGIKKLRS